MLLTESFDPTHAGLQECRAVSKKGEASGLYKDKVTINNSFHDSNNHHLLCNHPPYKVPSPLFLRDVDILNPQSDVSFELSSGTLKD